MNHGADRGRSDPDALPAELERRIAILEDPANQGAEFDASSWMWLVVLGLLIPIAILIWGWW
ncbi:MAG: hypothetical protein JWN43_4678 [Gammaproteobacteria bacterium]|nr:hypothetical protein [Gammaproteobacteria bacterium]